MLTLAIETSTAAGSVALLRDDEVVGARDVAMGASREDALFPAIVALLTECRVTSRELDEVVCGEGPGSFTSLRIAGAIAKGLAHANHIPLYGVSSLLLAAASVDDLDAVALTDAAAEEFVVHSDALRGERYAQRVARNERGLWRTTSVVTRLHESSLSEWSGDRRRLRVSASPRVATTPSSASASLANASSANGAPAFELVDELVVTPSAAALPRLLAWRSSGAVSLATWEPSYGRLAEAQVKWEATHQQTLDGALREGVGQHGDAAS